MSVRIIELKKSVFADNDAEAEKLRNELDKRGTRLVNLMSSPGSGKTSSILRIAENLPPNVSFGVMEADIDSAVDANKINEAGIPVVQVHTDGMCHLDAGMTRSGIESPEMKKLDLIILENVGNLVCPAEFDTGSHINAMILSVPEGDDKPLKYPLMFSICDLLIVSKIDTLAVFDFDMKKLKERVYALNPNITIIETSAKTGEGFEAVARFMLEYTSL